MGLAVAMGGALASAAQAKVGVGSKFADAVLENLAPGLSYNIRELRGIPYTINNVGDADQDVGVEVVRPAAGELQPGYEPIPDPNWIKLTPNQLRIPRGGTAFSDIIITIPDDPKLQGRHFQAAIWAHTVNTGLLGAGVKSRIRLSIGPGPDSLAAEKKRKAMVSLNFDVWPQALYVNEAEAGQRYDVKKLEKKSVKITNRGDQRLEVLVKAVPWTNINALPEGYEAGDPAWLKFKPEMLKIKPDRVKDVKVILDIPAEQKGKKLAFLFYLTLPSGTEISTVNRVLVEVK
ncbi:MAG: hypothetical protein A3J79_11315 [Elusimicrobia bacterium RIFOXYB2_FULL_62_6]|nr:MAG: hypothetical protein A3J79_11315 [Elusimicrobia bacterium RIFOXYB2_FULL_62_6]